ncbi:transcriptional regulator [Streptomyces tateyamensis]|uniref:Transcriptional regulator n=1 Tax=Streptomyces tateyamensis TaxID=565073 RepID=A0A2V4NCC5_9ACTN|nr:helix-turn-helix transcriptional regulator [Streptomyces tateyamensis]PYC77744.1 transcriptional regulator [Streptomyces tateyamensis]
MPLRDTPTARQQRVGIELRKMRDASGKTGAQAAAMLGLDRTKITHIEKGLYPVTADRVRRLASFYDECESEYVEALAAMAVERRAGWWEKYRGLLPVGLLEISEVEFHAKRGLRTYQICNPPGLLQTEETARAVFKLRRPALPALDLEARIAHRMQRAEILTQQNPIPYEAIVHEAGLRMRFGGPEVAYRQLEHLRKMAELPNITLRVLTFEAPGFSGGGQMVLYAGGDVERLDSVQVDSAYGPAFLDDANQLKNFRSRIDEMADWALSPADSLSFLDDLLRAL